MIQSLTVTETGFEIIGYDGQEYKGEFEKLPMPPEVKVDPKAVEAWIAADADAAAKAIGCQVFCRVFSLAPTWGMSFIVGDVGIVVDPKVDPKKDPTPDPKGP